MVYILIKGIRGIFLLTFFLCNFSYAGPWLQNKGHLQVINQSFLLYQSLTPYENAHLTSEHRVQSIQPNIYVEYGVTRRLTLGINMLASQNFLVNVSDKQVADQTFGLNFLQLFTRIPIVRYKNFIWSQEITAQTPAWHTNSSLALSVFGNQTLYNLETKTQIGISFGKINSGFESIDGGGRFFIGVGAGYRQRFNLPFNEIFVEALIGINLSSKLTIMLNFIKTFTVYKSGQAFDQFTNLNRDMNRFIITVVSKINSNMSFSAGFLFDVAQGVIGNAGNRGGSIGGVVGVWYSF